MFSVIYGNLIKNRKMQKYSYKLYAFIFTLLFTHMSTNKAIAKGDVVGNFFCLECDNGNKCNCYQESNVKAVKCNDEDAMYKECIVLCKKHLTKLACSKCTVNSFGYLECKCAKPSKADYFSFNLIDELLPPVKKVALEGVGGNYTGTNIIYYPQFIYNKVPVKQYTPAPKKFIAKPKPKPEPVKVIEEPKKSLYGDGYSFKQGYERQFMIKCEDDGTCDPVKYQKYKDL